MRVVVVVLGGAIVIPMLKRGPGRCRDDDEVDGQAREARDGQARRGRGRLRAFHALPTCAPVPMEESLGVVGTVQPGACGAPIGMEKMLE